MAKATLNPYAVNSVRCAAPTCNNVREKLQEHWFVTLVSGGEFTCRPYDPELPLQASEQPVCGEACALRLFGRYLSTMHPVRKMRDASMTSRGPGRSDGNTSSNSVLREAGTQPPHPEIKKHASAASDANLRRDHRH